MNEDEFSPLIKEGGLLISLADKIALSKWRKDKDSNLIGSIELPLTVGVVGGSTRVNPLHRRI